jgi:hypothetical protein
MWNEELSGKNCAFLRRLREHVPAASRLLAKHDSPDPAARCLPSMKSIAITDGCPSASAPPRGRSSVVDRARERPRAPGRRAARRVSALPALFCAVSANMQIRIHGCLASTIRPDPGSPLLAKHRGAGRGVSAWRTGGTRSYNPPFDPREERHFGGRSGPAAGQS